MHEFQSERLSRLEMKLPCGQVEARPQATFFVQPCAVWSSCRSDLGVSLSLPGRPPQRHRVGACCPPGAFLSPRADKSSRAKHNTK
eukprot:366474-Chlamydomonas_euryale.AAC.29